MKRDISDILDLCNWSLVQRNFTYLSWVPRYETVDEEYEYPWLQDGKFHLHIKMDPYNAFPSPVFDLSYSTPNEIFKLAENVKKEEWGLSEGLRVVLDLAYKFAKSNMEEETTMKENYWNEMTDSNSWEKTCMMCWNGNILMTYPSKAVEGQTYEIKCVDFPLGNMFGYTLLTCVDNGLGNKFETAVMSCEEIEPLLQYAARLEKKAFKKRNDGLEELIKKMKDHNEWYYTTHGVYMFQVDDTHKLEFVILSQINKNGNLETASGIPLYEIRKNDDKNYSVDRHPLFRVDPDQSFIRGCGIRPFIDTKDEYEKLLRKWHTKGVIKC